jgi:DNA (cytosine-5)-methyltransferase 1
MKTMTDVPVCRFHEPDWVDTTSIPISPQYTVVDLCCGSGGFTLAFLMAGYLPLLGIECERWAAATFRHNFPDVPLLESAVERLTDAEILDAIGGRRVDVICSGLPCPGFSTNGNQKGDDGRNWLFMQLVRLVELLQPHTVVIENVAPIGTIHDGVFGRWVSAAFADVGYDTISLQVLNAAAYGVPQSRKRAIIVANRWGLPNPYPIPIFDERFFRTVDAAIGDLQGLPQKAVPNHEWPKLGAGRQARITALSYGEPLYENFTGCCRRLRPDRPANTVTANNGVPHVHPHEHRLLSVREMARLQGFPDSFLFCGGLTAGQRQVGNAIPPPLAEHIALALRVLLGEMALPLQGIAAHYRPDGVRLPGGDRK